MSTTVLFVISIRSYEWIFYVDVRYEHNLLIRLKEQAREDLLGQRLDDLDRLLYQIEGQFEDLEGVL